MLKKIIAGILVLSLAAGSISFAAADRGGREAEKVAALDAANKDAEVGFMEKIRNMSEETDIYHALLKENYEEGLQAFLGSLDTEECYQYTVFMQYELLMMIVQEGMPEEKKETLDSALNILKENSDFLLQKSETMPIDVSKEELEQTLFTYIYADKYTDVKYVPEGAGKEINVDNFINLRGYLADSAPDDTNIQDIYDMLGCYRGEVSEVSGDIEKQQKECNEYLKSLYQADNSGKEQQEVETGKEEEKDADAQPEDGVNVEGHAGQAVQEGEPGAVLPSTTTSEVTGEGVLVKSAGRSIDVPPDPAGIPGGIRLFGISDPSGQKEEKYYEVYARTPQSSIVESLQVEVSVAGAGSQGTYEAETGDYELDGTQYNWRLRLPYAEIPLAGTDGAVTTALTAFDAEGKTVGEARNNPWQAQGVYGSNRKWLGPDFSILNTNKNPDQVYYVYGTVYSDDHHSHQIYRNSLLGTGTFSHLSISSYNADKATVIVRRSGYANKGTWLTMYGVMELYNLNIISTGDSGEVGIVSAQTIGSITPGTRQSRLTASNCNFSNADKWGIHGGANSYLDISNCTIRNTKGGVGGHGQIDIKNTTLDNTGSAYGGRPGVHLNVPVAQGGFRHSMNLENNSISGYSKGIEYQVSNFFTDQPAGERLNALSMHSTGYGNRVLNCPVGVTISQNGVSIPVSIDLQSSVSEIKNCTAGIQTENKNDTFKMSGGSIHDNTNGVQSAGTFAMSGGNVRNNTTGVNNAGALTVSGGQVYGNAQGVYQNGSFLFTGGQINSNTGCDVYLETGHVIDWTGQECAVIRINSRSRVLGTELVRNQFTNGIGNSAEKWFDVVHGGRFTDRGGDRNGSRWGSLVLSEYYRVTYLSNGYGEISNMPDNGVKYWKEIYTVPNQEPLNKSYGYIKFKGWDYNGDGIPDANRGSNLTMNKDIVMKALWKDSIVVRYFPNGGTGTKKEERITQDGIMSLGGYYIIRKNAGFINSSRQGYTFVGFDFDSNQNPKQVAYKEGQKNQISFSDMLKLSYEAEGQLLVNLYAIWDKQPDIHFQGTDEFYEGTDVKCSDLKQNVTVWDQEDGDITGSLRIVEIRYADGKLEDGVPTAGYTVKFGSDMSESDRLDTWFMALDKDKSPITHTIIYEATDSMGGVTKAEHKARVKYNEFPEIITRDRYFTLEEAQSGTITEELLTKDALESGKVKVTDAEEDLRDSEYIKSRLELTNFVPEEFTSIKYGGMIMLEYAVKDSMGPEGEGKETRQKVKIHVVKQGEIPPAPVTSRVRFIDEENYRKNEGKAELNLTPEEKEKLNKNGGLHVDSIWYTNPKNKALIERCFDEDAEPLEVYEFTDAEAEEAKKFIEENSIGNSQDPTALSRFKEKFMNKDNIEKN